MRKQIGIIQYSSMNPPLPGPPSTSKPVRHKSKMHHTTGFDTREEAVASVDEKRFKDQFGDFKRAFEEDIPWDGEGTPVITAYFSGDGTKILM